MPGLVIGGTGHYVGEGWIGSGDAASGAYVAELSAPDFDFTAQALTRFNDWIGTLSAPAFNFTAQALSYFVAFAALLSAPFFKFSAYALDVVADVGAAVGGRIGGFLVNVAKGIGR
jgi:hypothetical protein